MLQRRVGTARAAAPFFPPDEVSLLLVFAAPPPVVVELGPVAGVEDVVAFGALTVTGAVALFVNARM